MMEEIFDRIGKQLPYHESEKYLDNLMDKAADAALQQQGKPSGKKHWGLMWASAAAVALLLIGIGFHELNDVNRQPAATVQAGGPFDEFLNSLTDEEVAQLPYYEIEEIPEY